MKVDPQSIQIGMAVVAFIAALLGFCRRRLARVFACYLAAFLAFELFCALVRFDWVESLWWMVHMPSALLLGADEILERHGALVSTVFHLGDYFLWSAVFIGAVLLWERIRRHDRAVV
jgi:hypothetical protein